MKLLIVLLLLMSTLTHAQETVPTKLLSTYPTFREPSLDQRRFKHADLQPLLANLDRSLFSVKKVGASIEGREISMVSIGKGPVQVLLWSQMHGDESTATMALFDIFHFLKDKSVLQKEKEQLFNALTIHFIPMLNPDGAERFRRRNALNVDINRDAVRLQSPEARLLKGVRDSLDADFGFNLHDQSRYYNAERTEKQATISVLAPAFNYEKDINEVRGNAMKLIVYMNQVLQKMDPGHVARYNDDFEPRAFGDNIQKWGTSTILIESGGYPDDPEKQHIRKMNYVAILSSLFAIADKSYEKMDISKYEEIPWNDSKLFDLLLEGVSFPLDGKQYTLDIGIQRNDIDLPDHLSHYGRGNISDIGDLSTYFGYEKLAAAKLTYSAARIYPEIIANFSSLKSMDLKKLLLEGYAYFKLAELPPAETVIDLPVILVATDYMEVPSFGMGAPATFFLKKDNTIRYGVLNGFLIDLTEEWPDHSNGLILRGE